MAEFDLACLVCDSGGEGHVLELLGIWFWSLSPSYFVVSGVDGVVCFGDFFGVVHVPECLWFEWSGGFGPSGGAYEDGYWDFGCLCGFFLLLGCDFEGVSVGGDIVEVLHIHVRQQGEYPASGLSGACSSVGVSCPCGSPSCAGEVSHALFVELEGDSYLFEVILAGGGACCFSCGVDGGEQ